MAIDMDKMKKRKAVLDDKKKKKAIKKRAKREYYLNQKNVERTMHGDYHVVKKEKEDAKLAQEKEITKFLNKKEKAKKKREKEQAAKDRTKKMPYDKYIVSTHWKKRRKLLLESMNYRCEICNVGHGLHAHHNNYKTRGDEQDCDITVLCAECHGMFHKKNKVASKRRIEPEDRRCSTCARLPHIAVIKEPRNVQLCEKCFKIFFKKLHNAYHKDAFLGKEAFEIKFIN